jgi:hypothetical protein
MACENRSDRHRPPSHRGLPVDAVARQFDLVEHRVDHGVEQLLLVRHVVVERHRARVEHTGQPSHAQPVDPLAVGEPDRLRHHPLRAQPRIRRVLALFRGHGISSLWVDDLTTVQRTAIVQRTTYGVRTVS